MFIKGEYRILNKLPVKISDYEVKEAVKKSKIDKEKHDKIINEILKYLKDKKGVFYCRFIKYFIYFANMATAIYTDFKIEQGYNADEIVSKTRSLKGVLEPFSTQGNLELLKRAGFVDVMTILKYVCFVGFLAIK